MSVSAPFIKAVSNSNQTSERSDSTEAHQWLDIIQYAQLKNISISTVRRMIKNHQVKWKKNRGKYYLFAPERLNETQEQFIEKREDYLQGLEEENSTLRKQLERIAEENQELKMLVTLYESKLFPRSPSRLDSSD